MAQPAVTARAPAAGLIGPLLWDDRQQPYALPL
jgi:hypothetical protein